MFKRTIIFCLLFSGIVAIAFACGKGSGNDPVNPPTPPAPTPPVTGTNDMDFWLTKNDQSVLLQKQTTVLSFGSVANSHPNIKVDASQSFQTVDGFGFTLTGGSAYVINKLNAADKSALLKELFGNEATSISISYLRISIGASFSNSSIVRLVMSRITSRPSASKTSTVG